MIKSETESNTERDIVDLSAPAANADNGNDNANGNDNNNDNDNTLLQNTDAPKTSPKEPDESTGVRYGKCKWFNVAKGWGFIKPNDGGPEVFVHQSVIQMTGFRSLGEQEEVEFECQLTERGLEATRVSGRQGTDCHGSTFRPRTKKRHRRVRCYNCGEFANHIASKCHLGPQPKRCHLCKKDDHLFANCPTKQSTTSESIEHSSKDESSSLSENTTKEQQQDIAKEDR